MLEIGDILLEYNGNSEFEKAVLDSGNHHYFHCGLVISETEIIEATPENGVQIQLLSELTQHKFHVFRVSEFKIVSEKLSEQIKRVIGKKYNHYFLEQDEGYYCSELIQHLINSVYEREVIKSIPMTFVDEYGDVIEYWKIYFKECIEGIPEGLQGTHPSNIILCKEISFKGEYHAN